MRIKNKFIRGALSVVAWILTIYIGYFFIWQVFLTACEQKYGLNNCGGSVMEESIKVGYGWIFEKLK
jgi:hypothetical protein